MTRQEIEAQLRLENPITSVDGVQYSTGEALYEALLQKWADAMEAQNLERGREAAYQAVIESGHCVTAGYCLGMSPEDRANWSQMLTLFREAEALGAMTGASEVQFWDQDGIPRTATLSEFRLMILGLGQAVIAAETARRAPLP
jgi:hypothetical protein